MLEVLREQASALRSCRDWPRREALQALITERGATTAAGAPLTLVEPSDDAYETQLYERGELQVRERNWHDLFTVLIWLRYPAAKQAVNRRHALAARTETAGRGRVRDALTLFDESGVIVSSSDPSLLDDLRHFRWKRLFWERREEVRQGMRFSLFGHALAEKALAPYVGLTAHAVLVGGLCAPCDADGVIAEYLRNQESFSSPRALAPLPVLGVPGWWAQNEEAAFYDNTAYFRPGRRS